MDIALLILGSLGLVFVAGYTVVTVQRRKKLAKLRALFPDSPFPLSVDMDGGFYFDLSDGDLEFHLLRGTKSNGIYGVIGIELQSSPKFTEGMDMFRLMNELAKLTTYIKSLSYTLKDSWSFVEAVRKEVAQINTLDYIETKESQGK